MNRNIFFMIGFGFLIACSGGEKASCPDADRISVTWEFFGNDATREISEAAFTLENNGRQALESDNWNLYFNGTGMGILEESITGSVKIEHVNGDLARIVPSEGFRLGKGEKVEIRYQKHGRLINVSEAPEGLYFVFGRPDGKEQRVTGVKYFSVKPFPDLDRIFPPGSGIPLPDAGWVFEQNGKQARLEPGTFNKILPGPKTSKYSGGTEILSAGMKIHFQGAIESEAGYLADLLGSLLGERPVIESSPDRGPNTVLLTMAGSMDRGAEAYALSTEQGKGVVIEASTGAGVFYGIQSLLSLVPVDAWKNIQQRIELECVNILDYPTFMYRGIMLDVARNFHHPEAVKKLMDIMAFYKMNRLHLSLTNDEAWRLEIPSLPELTRIGAYRGHITDSRECLIPAYGSGPDPDPEKSSGSGFYTREQFIDLLVYARSRHIDIIPEINFPGHARAAIYAMEARYERLMQEGKPGEAQKYRLADPGDESVYHSAQNYNDNITCVCQEAPYVFLEKVIDEIMSMYRDAGMELKVIHTGGDEVPRGSWSGSPICREFLAGNPDPRSPEDLQVYFSGRLLDILSRRNLVMGAWEEAALVRGTQGKMNPNNDFAGKGMLPYVWNSQGANLDLGYRLANAGFPVVLCNVSNFYFDLAYNHHPSEPGLHWGGYVDTRRAFEFAPYNVFRSTITDLYRRPLPSGSDFSGFEALKPEVKDHIIGLQGQLWSETLRNDEIMEYYYLPKMLGLAERAWSGQPEWGDIEDRGKRIEVMDEAWNVFANQIGQREMPRLDYIFGGYDYRIPPPGAVIRESMLMANSCFPGLEIRYTTDGSEPVPDSPLYMEPVSVSGIASVRAFDTRGRGSRVSIAVPQ